MLVGKAEAVVREGQGKPQRPALNQNPGGSGSLIGFVVRIVAFFWKKSFVELSQILINGRSTVCPHRTDETCLLYVLKVLKKLTSVTCIITVLQL